MLRGNDDRVDAQHFAISVIFHGDLGFSIGTKEGKCSVLAHLGEPHGELVRQRDGSGHQLLVLVAGIAKHHSLVAGAAGVHAHCDVPGLLVDAGDHGASVAIEAVDGVVIADGADGAADYALEIDISLGGDFAGNDDQAGCGESFAGHAAEVIFGEAGVEDCVRNLVGDLIGMAFRHRFGSE